MRALAKLVAMNDPDLILFVGEALVGNDAVDQLKKFNQALIDLTATVSEAWAHSRSSFDSPCPEDPLTGRSAKCLAVVSSPV